MHLIDQELQFMLRGQFEEGWNISQQLEAIGEHEITDPSGKKNPEMWLRHNFNRGWFLLQQGKFQEGCQLLESGRFLNVYGSGHLKTNKPIWNKENLTNKTVILTLEGGFGDEIIHVRFAKSLAAKGANVVVAADPKLHSIVSRIEGVSKVIRRDEVEKTTHDFWIPAFSAGWLCGHTYNDLPPAPYIFPLDTFVSKWKKIIKSDKIKVGIRWSGNPQFEHQQFRNFNSELLIALAKHPELQVYSLQRDNDTRELPDNIIDLQHSLETWEDTAAAIENLDLVISSCTSVAHLSAAMNKPTWVLTPILPYHTWAVDAPKNTSSPWYSSVKLYRQQKFAKWNETFSSLYKDIEEKFKLSTVLTVDQVLGENFTMQKDKLPVDFTVKNKEKCENNTQQALFFMAGLPQAGGNLILDILSQNPELHAASKSGLQEALSAVIAEWNKNDYALNDTAKRKILEQFISSYHTVSEKSVVIDKNRNWITKIFQLEAILQKPVKIICPVRNPAEILASYEKRRRQNSLKLNEVDASAESSATIASRCFFYSKPTGLLGTAHAQLLDAVTMGFQEKLLFVDYNKFCNEPQKQLKRIYNFLGIDEYDHSTNGIIKKDTSTPIEIIGFDLFQQYNNQIFWQSWI